ncbi:MAG: peptidoglycan editing factor PgeF [Burkholderiaceae bacterium]
MADSLTVAGACGVMTTQTGGLSIAASLGGDGELGGGLNLGLNTVDKPAIVYQNRHLVAAQIARPIQWLHQVHGTCVRVVDVVADSGVGAQDPVADAAVTVNPDIALGILTADCLPVLLAAPGIVGVAHAGWRGLAAGVIEATVAGMQSCGAQPEMIRAWLGPVIGAQRFEVGQDVFDRFCGHDELAVRHFRQLPTAGKWLADLPGLARLGLNKLGINEVSGGHWCTMSDSRFFSYRADPHCGRMAGIVWIAG